jgi:hypothetical protein
MVRRHQPAAANGHAKDRNPHTEETADKPVIAIRNATAGWDAQFHRSPLQRQHNHRDDNEDKKNRKSAQLAHDRQLARESPIIYLAGRSGFLPPLGIP